MLLTDKHILSCLVALVVLKTTGPFLKGLFVKVKGKVLLKLYDKLDTYNLIESWFFFGSLMVGYFLYLIIL